MSSRIPCVTQAMERFFLNLPRKWGVGGVFRSSNIIEVIRAVLDFFYKKI